MRKKKSHKSIEAFLPNSNGEYQESLQPVCVESVNSIKRAERKRNRQRIKRKRKRKNKERKEKRKHTFRRFT
jgi:hypothetical protein